MLKSYLKIAVRHFVRQKGHAVIKLLGLSLGLACGILILLYVRQEWWFDRFHENRKRIFRVVEATTRPDGELRLSAWQPLPLAPALQTEFPEVKSFVRFLTSGGTVAFGDQIHQEEFVFTDVSFFQVFSFSLLQGDPATALLDPHAVVITEQMATKYFGDENPVGKVLRVSFWRTQEDFKVAGVVRTIPDNSTLRFDFLFPISAHHSYERIRGSWRHYNCSTYLLLENSEQAAALQLKMPGFIQEFLSDYLMRGRQQGRISDEPEPLAFRFQPLEKVHLQPSVAGMEPVSNPVYSYILAGVAILVLFIACVNFVVLEVARSGNRAREVGVRKTLGASRSQLMRQFSGETLLLCLLATLLGIGLAELFLPTFNQFVKRELVLDRTLSLWTVVGFVGLVTLVGLAAGGYPAAYLSRFHPVAVLTRKAKLSRRHRLSSVLLVLQFGISILLITCTLFIFRQLYLLLTKNLGYLTEQVVVIPTFTFGDAEAAAALIERYRTRLARYSQVAGVTGVDNAFAQGWDREGFEYKGAFHRAFVYRVDPHYLQTLDIELAQGRNFAKEMATDEREAIIVNQTLLREFEITPSAAIGKWLKGWHPQTLPEGPVIIGVAKDYHFLSLHNQIAPVILTLDPERPLNNVLVRISSGDISTTLNLLQTVWREVAPDKPFEFSFLDADIEAQYQEETRWSKIITTAAIFACFLACLGILGLAAQNAATRTKEIGIRKVLGATVSNLVALLSSDLAKLVLLANLIAWPPTWFVMQAWLNNYAYRVGLDWWVFVLAGGLALVIALLTVSTQAVRAALANPVKSLRYE
ncbi:MAG: ABC transporter permease [Calditrichaeota bacterium]|nr:ABC transporter permease [Calditrichota bacterium]